MYGFLLSQWPFVVEWDDGDIEIEVSYKCLSIGLNGTGWGYCQDGISCYGDGSVDIVCTLYNSMNRFFRGYECFIWS